MTGNPASSNALPPPKGFNPFADLVGLVFTGYKKGWSQCELAVRDQIMNPNRVLHGGAIYAMADTGMGAALYAELPPGKSCSTIEIKISYFKPVTAGMLVCRTQVVHRGRRIAAVESTVFNDERLVAKASGTFYIFKLKAN
ncbi:MAG: PaaI family thioesterase [Anaerolineae bacterium]